MSADGGTGHWWTSRAFMHTPGRMAHVATGARLRHGWTVQHLADMAGVDPGTVDAIESGMPRLLDVDSVDRVFHVLGVKILALPSTLAGGTP